MKYLYKNKRAIAGGFTIIETLVAIALILISVAATLGAAQLGLQSSEFAEDQITSYYLAEEAIEQVRNVRDSNYVANPDCAWLDNNANTDPACETIPPACMRSATNNTPVACGVDVVTDPTAVGMKLCSDPTENSCKLLLDPNLGYNYSSGAATPFVRSVDIQLLNPYEAMVTATVSWTTGNFNTQKVVLREDLFDWNHVSAN